MTESEQAERDISQLNLGKAESLWIAMVQFSSQINDDRTEHPMIYSPYEPWMEEAEILIDEAKGKLLAIIKKARCVGP